MGAVVSTQWKGEDPAILKAQWAEHVAAITEDWRSLDEKSKIKCALEFANHKGYTLISSRKNWFYTQTTYKFERQEGGSPACYYVVRGCNITVHYKGELLLFEEYTFSVA